MQTPYGTVKVHFTSGKRAWAASVDGSATAGQRTPSGRVKTWIAQVAKTRPTETAQEAAARVAETGKRPA